MLKIIYIVMFRFVFVLEEQTAAESGMKYVSRHLKRVFGCYHCFFSSGYSVHCGFGMLVIIFEN